MQVEVFFKNSNAPFVVNVENVYKRDTMVVIETMRGVELGKIGNITKARARCKFVRLASDEDVQRAKDLEERANTIRDEVQQIMNDMGFDVKVSLIEFTLDARKMIVHFASEVRIDFRGLVKVLANKYKKKIEMHQIGLRDEVRYKGGVGTCGRECCCKAFLTNFDKVSIKMAKNQNISLGPNRVSGVCGKLLCCLAYENDMYIEGNKKMPRVHQKVKTPEGEAEVVYNDILRERVHVRFENGGYNLKDYPLSEIHWDER